MLIKTTEKSNVFRSDDFYTIKSGAPGLPCPDFGKVMKKAVPPSEVQLHRPVICVSLRWHYPNQVMGQDLTVYSQPAPLQAPRLI